MARVAFDLQAELVTKADLREATSALQADLRTAVAELKGMMAQMIAEAKTTMIQWQVGVALVLAGLMVALKVWE